MTVQGSSRELTGLHIVVTGGAGALGGAVVSQLVAAGAAVHVPCFDDGPGARGISGAEYTPNIELTDETAVRDYYAALPALWASVHLAGGFAWATLDDTTPDLARSQWSQNALTCLLCSREAVRKLRAGGKGGRLVNVTSRAVAVPGAGVTAYAMSKAAVSALTQTLAEELRDEHILVNAVAPGIIDTPVNRKSMPQADYSRWPRPEELAQAIAFLVSPANTATTGAIVPVYGRS